MSFMNASYGVESILLFHPVSGIPLAASVAVNSFSYNRGTEMMPLKTNGGETGDMGAGDASDEVSFEVREFITLSKAIATNDANAVPEILEVASIKATALVDTSAEFAKALTGTTTSVVPVELMIVATTDTELEVFLMSASTQAQTPMSFSFGKFPIVAGTNTSIDLSAAYGTTIILESSYAVKAGDFARVSVLPGGMELIEAGTNTQGTQVTTVGIMVTSEKTVNGSQAIIFLPKVAFANPFNITMTNKEMGVFPFEGMAMVPAPGRSVMEYRHIKPIA